jgi:hypothetical protein
MISECASVLHSTPPGMRFVLGNEHALTLIVAPPGIIEDAVNVLNGLFVSVPAFWGGKELTQIMKIYVDQSGTTRPSASLNSLMKTLTKKAQFNVLLPTLAALWLVVSQTVCPPPKFQLQIKTHLGIEKSRRLRVILSIAQENAAQRTEICGARESAIHFQRVPRVF